MAIKLFPTWNDARDYLVRGSWSPSRLDPSVFLRDKAKARIRHTALGAYQIIFSRRRPS
jgi:hypothetical protein